ncbi:hypothetical protein NSK_005436 [Nannochloropsis salina CCMP1776]|uniref:Late embryogenesis abundant protein LEA-2 subgroup domain-containing protein n=1 Tax=Nannochloropsis salina CCMP1776 TaxID=1027361 RepID=A0A4D9CXS4_9STRA|nr:hypothetical protein NSK_005436 [Nannochloropsis salina CCMP1776]|eukprot:TFJ83274.1 hypothetical protein NSK_005436 [Nannochloropsis salina CCMP1776]
MPKWKYRLMVSSIVVLLISFLLLLFVSVVYGFGMSLPHIEVVAVDVVLPLPPEGSLPVRSLMRVNNPNRFSILVHPTDISIYSHPTRSPGSLLGVSTIPEHLLHAREGAHTTESVFVVRDLGSIEGGPLLAEAVLTGGPTFFYTRAKAELTVMSLGFMSIGRAYILECTVLKYWGKDILLSDCYGRFTR